MPFSKLFKKAPINIGLDIGSASMRIVLLSLQRDNTFKIIASKQTASAGISHGRIIDSQMALACLRDLIKQVEQETRISIRSLQLGISSGNIQGITNHAYYRLPDQDYLIDNKHIAFAIEKARALDLQQDRFIIDEHNGRFYIDKRETTHYPIGLAGRTLELSSHLIVADKAQLKQQLSIIRQTGVEIENIHFGPLAAAQYLLTKQEKEDGKLLIDLGASTSNYICYQNGDILASGSIMTGCEQINASIIEQKSEKISYKAIEEIKKRHGDAFGDLNDSTLISYQHEHGLSSLKIEQGLLNQIICEHYSGIFAQILKKLNQTKTFKRSMNISLIGGGSLIRNVDQLAMEIFDMPVEVGEASEMSYNTAIGLAQMGALYG